MSPSTLMTHHEAETSSFMQDIEPRRPLHAGSPARPGVVGLPRGMSRDRSSSREPLGSPLPPLSPPRSSPLSARVPLPSDEAEISGPSALLQRRLSGRAKKHAAEESTVGRSGGTEMLRTEGVVDEKLKEMREAFEASLKSLGSGGSTASGSKASTVRASSGQRAGLDHRRQVPRLFPPRQLLPRLLLRLQAQSPPGPSQARTSCQAQDSHLPARPCSWRYERQWVGGFAAEGLAVGRVGISTEFELWKRVRRASGE